MSANNTVHSERFPNLYYRKYGSGEAVVLLHGFPSDGELWHEVWPGLQKEYLVIVPDIPGSGKSKFSGAEVSIEELADSINLILEQEGIRKAVIVGHSMGGYIALAFAARYGNKVSGLSLVHSTAFADTEEKANTRKKSIELIQKGGKEPFIKQMIPNLFSSTFRDAHTDVLNDQIENGLKLEAGSMIAFYNSMINRPDRTEVLKNAAFPVMWVLGKQDNIITFDSQLQQSKLANVNFIHIYNDSGHMSMLENAGELQKDLAAFANYCVNKK